MAGVVGSRTGAEWIEWSDEWHHPAGAFLARRI
jgi:hypothetical protein